MGASPAYTFFHVVVPLIAPGVISGALFAFITSFDEVVAVLFLSGPEQRTVPRQMWSGIREQISPTILAVRHPVDLCIDSAIGRLGTHSKTQ